VHEIQGNPTTCLGRFFDIKVWDKDKFHNLPPDLFDFQVTNGTYRCLESMFHSLAHDFRLCMKEYNSLQIRRLKVFEELILYPERAKYPMDKWLDRHPNSYITNDIKGLEFDTPDLFVKVRLCERISHRLNKVIDIFTTECDITTNIERITPDPVEEFIIKNGLPTESEKPLPVKRNSFPASMLKLHYRAVWEFFLRTCQTIVGMEDSEILDIEPFIRLGLNMQDYTFWSTVAEEYGSTAEDHFDAFINFQKRKAFEEPTYLAPEQDLDVTRDEEEWGQIEKANELYATLVRISPALGFGEISDNIEYSRILGTVLSNTGCFPTNMGGPPRHDDGESSDESFDFPPVDPNEWFT
jgi:hypothetical protein